MADELFNARELGLSDAEEFFIYAGYRSADMREPLHRAKAIIQMSMQGAFDTEGVSTGLPWVPLSDDYAAWKESSIWAGEPMLRLTHEMLDVVMSDEAWHITMENAIFSPPSEKAGWHQAGVLGRHGGGRNHDGPNPLPARPFLNLGDAEYGAIEEVFYQWLDDLRTANTRRGGPGEIPFPAIFS